MDNDAIRERLREISDFGSVDAESDDLLARCFEVHPALEEILTGRRFLVLGRKGSGKTAIYTKLLSPQEHNVFSVGHSFADYPWQHHDAQVMPSAAEQERYLHSWRYLILMSLAKILLNHDQSQPHSDQVQDALAKIERFVIDSYGSRDPDITEIFHPGKRLRRLKSFEIDLKILKLGTGGDELSMGELPKVFQDVNRSMLNSIMTCLNPANKYYVCFDQLDTSFQPNSQEYKQRLIGLILAARDFVNAAREAGRSLKVLVFLRSDIYHKSLLFEDKNKITDTYSIELEWDQSGQRATLKTLMERRFAELLNVPQAAAWEQVFDETQEMRGHQTKYQHILDRTFLRPRDVIKFCNCVLDIHKQRLELETNSQFSNEDVNLAHKDYSNYLRAELIDELHKYSPDHKIYFEMLRQLGYPIFTLEEMNASYQTWQGRLAQPLPKEDVLEQLYEFSIVGFYRAGGGGYGGAEWVYKYLDHRAEFNRSSIKYRVHSGLVESLGLKQYSRSSAQPDASEENELRS